MDNSLNLNSNKLKKIFMLTLISSATISCILRTISMLFFYDSNIGYFSSGAVLPVISTLFLIISVCSLIPLSYFAFKNGEKTVVEPTATPTMIVAAILPSLSFALLAVSDIISNGGVAAILLDVIASAFFATSISKINKYLKVGFGFFVIVRLALLIYKTHFNWTIPSNAPDKILFLIACGVAVLFISQELKCFSLSSKPALYLFSASATVIIAITSSISTLVASYAGIIKGTGGLNAESYIILTVAIYAAIRATVAYKATLKTDEQ